MMHPFRSTTLTTTLALSALALAYHFLIYRPVDQQIASLRIEAAEKESQLSQASRLRPVRLEIEKELEQAALYLRQTHGYTPGEPQLTALMFAISEEAARAGVTIVRMDPQDRQALSNLELAPIEIGCRGELDQLHAMFLALEDLPIAVWTESLVVQPSGDPGEALVCEWRVVAFVSPARRDVAETPFHQTTAL